MGDTRTFLGMGSSEFLAAGSGFGSGSTGACGFNFFFSFFILAMFVEAYT